MTVIPAYNRAVFERVDDTAWQALGNCAKEDPELMSPQRASDVVRAQRVCNGCPVLDLCYQAHGHEDGETIFAGGRNREERNRFIQRHRVL